MKRLDTRNSELTAGLVVRRVLPQRGQRSVGPFVFFDHFGPVALAAGAGDVGAHPHIGLATVTYLLEGEFVHRDSLGTVQPIRPGAINWMSAGRGIVHSERAPANSGERRLHGLQLWVALPPELEDSAPSFQHVPASDVPVVEVRGARVRVLVGEAFGARSPVRVASPTLYLDVELAAGAALDVAELAEEVAIYAPTDGLLVQGAGVQARQMALLEPGETVASDGPARFVVIGGAAIRPVRMWWNFVAHDVARLEAAARLWESGGFDDIAGETERVASPPYQARPRG